MNRKVEITVGLFMVVVICAILFLCFRVTDATTFTNNSTYRVYAVFDNIGGLKARSPIKIGGVVIGRVADISLKDYKPYVTMDISSDYDKIPTSSVLSIKTSGLLGEQFIDVARGIVKSDEYDLDMQDSVARGIDVTKETNNQSKQPDNFEEGYVVTNTIPAIVIEDLIGKLVYSMTQPKSDSAAKPNSATETNPANN